MFLKALREVTTVVVIALVTVNLAGHLLKQSEGETTLKQENPGEPAGMMSVSPVNPGTVITCTLDTAPPTLTFFGGEGDNIGTLKYSQDKGGWSFTGNANASAIVFLNVLNTCFTDFVNQAISESLKQLKAVDKPHCED